MFYKIDNNNKLAFCHFCSIGDCELDVCDLHNQEEEDCDVCHHKKFPEETIKEKFGDDVKTCCAGHGYIFKDLCEVIKFLFRYQFFMQQTIKLLTIVCCDST